MERGDPHSQGNWPKVCLLEERVRIRGKFIGMRPQGTAMHTPYSRPTAVLFCALRRGEFVVVNGKLEKLGSKKVVVIPPKK